MNVLKYNIKIGRVAAYCIFCALCSCNNSTEHSAIPLISSTDSVEILGLKKRADSLSWSQPDSAFSLYQQALKRSRDLSFSQGIVENLIGLSCVATTHANYAEGFRYVNEGIAYLKAHKKEHSKEMGTLLNNMGGIYLYMGDYDKAAKLSYKATVIASDNKDYVAIARNANNFGSILSETGETEKALEYISKGKEIAYKYKDARYILSYLYLNEGRIQYWKKNYDYALSECQRAFQLATEFRQAGVQHDAIHLSGMIYEGKGNLAEAKKCYLEVLDMKPAYAVGKMRAAMSLGKLEMTAGRYQSAKKHLTAALQTARELNARRELVDIYKYLAQYYHKTGDYDNAFAHQELAMVLKDSILNLDKVKAVNLLEVKYGMAQKDKEIAENKLMISSQKAKIIRKNILIWGLVFIALVAIIILRIYYYNRQRSEKQRRKIAVWQALAEGEEKERSRLARELHDGIGGLLTTLKMQLGILAKRMPGVAAIDIYHESKRILDTTMTEVRKTAHNLMPELILLHGLVEAIRIFCNNIRDDEGLKMDFQYYGYIGNLEPAFQLAVYRIIQELLQNVLKHARASSVLVQLSRHSEVLDITVEDDGQGFDATAERKGMGLNSIEARVKELDGNIHISSAIGKGTYIYIEFNLDVKKEASGTAPEYRKVHMKHSKMNT